MTKPAACPESYLHTAICKVRTRDGEDNLHEVVRLAAGRIIADGVQTPDGRPRSAVLRLVVLGLYYIEDPTNLIKRPPP